MMKLVLKKKCQQLKFMLITYKLSISFQRNHVQQIRRDVTAENVCRPNGSVMVSVIVQIEVTKLCVVRTHSLTAIMEDV